MMFCKQRFTDINILILAYIFNINILLIWIHLQASLKSELEKQRKLTIQWKVEHNRDRFFYIKILLVMNTFNIILHA